MGGGGVGLCAGHSEHRLGGDTLPDRDAAAEEEERCHLRHSLVPARERDLCGSAHLERNTAAPRTRPDSLHCFLQATLRYSY